MQTLLPYAIGQRRAHSRRLIRLQKVHWAAVFFDQESLATSLTSDFIKHNFFGVNVRAERRMKGIVTGNSV